MISGSPPGGAVSDSIWKKITASSPGLARLGELKVGPVPLPLYLVLAGIVLAAAARDKLPADMLGGFAVIMILGMLLGDVGLKTPGLKHIGGPAILSIFIPSIMVCYHWLDGAALGAVTALMKGANFLYLYIACLVAGSILGMNRTILVQGFMRMFVPLVVGTLAAVAAGLLVGKAFGYEFHRTFFFIIIPIIGGGIGEGIIPLSIGYSEILGQTKESFIPQLIPAAMIGNIVAIMSAGYLKRLGERRPELSGKGLLVKTGEDQALLAAQAHEKPVEFPLMGAGLLLACVFFCWGKLAETFIGIPGAILMIFSAALVKYAAVLPARMELGAYQMYKFISSSLTWPLLVGLGALYTPWADVARVIADPGYIATCTATVLAMIASGFFIGKYMNMYPIESAIVTGCHSGLGGTGDVAILSAANRMELIPFAQISTRIGGAGMVVLATVLLKIWRA